MAELFGQDIHLKDYVKLVQKRLWVVVLTVAAVLALTWMKVSKQEPYYRTTARIQIDRESPKVLNFQEVVDPGRGYFGDEYYETQYALLRSRSLAWEVVERLDLTGDPSFLPRRAPPAPGLIERVRGVTGFRRAAAPSEIETAPVPAELSDAAVTSLINRFLGMVSVNPVKSTRLVDITTTARDGKLAARMANALAEAFIERNESTRRQTTRDATDWLSEQLEEARKKVEESEMALQRYKEANDIVSLENRQNLVVQKLEDFNTALIKAKTERIALETKYRQMEKLGSGAVGMDTLPEVTGNPVIQQLKRDRGLLESQLSDLSKTYTPKHPRIIGLKSQIENLDSRIEAEMEKAAASIRNQYEMAREQELSLQQAVELQKREVQDLSQKSIQYGVLEREAENNRYIYNVLLNREKETGLAEGLQTGNIRIVDRAEVPLGPVNPLKTQSMALAFLASLAGGIGLAFFLEYLDDSVKDPDDLEEYVKLPFLAPIPLIKPRDKNSPRELISHREPKSSFAEAYRTARTSIVFSSPDRELKSILFTSSGPQEGKTTTAVNLAVTLAQTGSKVLLVDADLRRPRVHEVFHLRNGFGLTDLLSESGDINAAAHRTGIPNLAVITSGRIPPNPSELLGSLRMRRLIQALTKGFDRVVIDCPPVISVTDASVLAAAVDGVVLVGRAGKTSRKVMMQTKRRLDEVRARVLGVILNFVDVRKSRYYDYIPDYYYSYYGDGHQKKRKRAG